MTKQKLFTIVTIILIAVIGLSSFIVSELTKSRLIKKLTEQYSLQGEVVVGETALVLQNEVASIQDKLNLIATIPDVKNGNTAACQAKLEEAFKVLNSKVGNIGRVNKDGLFQCSLNKALVGTKASKLGPYIDQIFNDPEHKPVLSKVILPPGANSYVEAIHVPVFDNNNQFIGTIGGAIYLNDLEQKFFKNIKLSPNGTIVLIDEDGKILSHVKREIIGKDVNSEEIQKLDNNEHTFQEIISKASATESNTIEYTFDNVPKVGAYRAIQVLPNRKWIAIVTIPFEDINAAVDELKVDALFNILLVTEGLIVILAALFFVLYLIHQFGQIDRAKDEFISIASHQLRTPLTAIRLYSEMLSKEGGLNTEQKEYSNIIQQSTLRMIKLVGDILNVSRIQLGSLKIDPQPTQITDLIRSIVEEIKPTADLKKLNIEFKTPSQPLPVLNVDPSLVRQVIHNLLTNSIRYSHENQTIKIGAFNGKEGVEIIVKDQGIGIPLVDQDKIFGRFFRAQNAVRKEGEGTGLGMYMAKMIMDTTGGKIWFESVENKGTTFHVIIPKSGMTKNQGTKSLS